MGAPKARVMLGSARIHGRFHPIYRRGSAVGRLCYRIVEPAGLSMKGLRTTGMEDGKEQFTFTFKERPATTMVIGAGGTVVLLQVWLRNFRWLRGRCVAEKAGVAPVDLRATAGPPASRLLWHLETTD